MRLVRTRRKARTRGQALAEFALVAPVFFLLLFGIVEGGRFIFFYQVLNNATREGARYAIVHGSNSSCPSGPMEAGKDPPACYDEPGNNVIQHVKNSALGILGPSVTVTPTWGPLNNAREGDVTVEASYTYSAPAPIPLPNITITAESRLVINN